MVDATNAGTRYWLQATYDSDYTTDADEAFWEWVNEELTQARADRMPEFDFHTLHGQFTAAFTRAREHTQRQDEQEGAVQ